MNNTLNFKEFLATPEKLTYGAVFLLTWSFHIGISVAVAVGGGVGEWFFLADLILGVSLITTLDCNQWSRMFGIRCNFFLIGSSELEFEDPDFGTTTSFPLSFLMVKLEMKIEPNWYQLHETKKKIQHAMKINK